MINQQNSHKMMIKMPKGYTSNSTTLFSLLLLMVPVIAFDLANLYHPKFIAKWSLKVFVHAIIVMYLFSVIQSYKFVLKRTNKIISLDNQFISFFIVGILSLLTVLVLLPFIFRFGYQLIVYDSILVLLLQNSLVTNNLKKLVSNSVKTNLSLTTNLQFFTKYFFIAILIEAIIKYYRIPIKFQAILSCIDILSIAILFTIKQNYNYITAARLRIKMLRQQFIILLKICLVLPWIQPLLERYTQDFPESLFPLLTLIVHLVLVAIIVAYIQEIPYIFCRRDFQRGRILLKQNEFKFTTKIQEIQISNNVNEQKLCRICHDNLINILFEPCGDFLICDRCVNRYEYQMNRTCYFCQAEIVIMVKLDLSRDEKDYPQFGLGIQTMLRQYEYRQINHY